MSKVTQVQYDIRNQSREISDYMSELDKWEKDINIRDQQLQQKSSNHSSPTSPPIRNEEQNNSPPIRNRKTESSSALKDKADTVKSVKFQAAEIVEERKDKLSMYDYGAWDKFDVDEALEAVDETVKETTFSGKVVAEHQDLKQQEDEEDTDSESESDEDDDMLLVMKNKQEAEDLKQKGNHAFKKGEIDAAIECYTRGMNLDQQNYNLPANRAIALIKKKQFGAAEADCDAVLDLCGNHIKAHLRRAVCRKHLKKYTQAKSDLMFVLKIEPKNSEAIKVLDEVEGLCKKKQCSDGTIKIEDSGDKEVKLSIEKTVSEEVATIHTYNKIEVLESADVVNIEPIYKPPHLQSKKPMRRLKVKPVGLDIEPIDTKANIPVAKVATPVEDVKVEAPEKDVEERAVPSTVLNRVPLPSTDSLPPPPTKFTQFSLQWKKMKGNSQLRYHYLKTIPSSQYSSLFGDFLDASLLSEILHILHSWYLPEAVPVIPHLVALTEVKRFRSIVCFMGGSDKKLISELIQASQESVQFDGLLDNLKAMYEIK